LLANDRFYERRTSGQQIMDLSLVAYAGDDIADSPPTARARQGRLDLDDGHCPRAPRQRGYARALKVEMLTRAKRKGLRAIGHDERRAEQVDARDQCEAGVIRCFPRTWS